MNIFFYQDQKNHSSLMSDLAWSGHNERIDQLEECKSLNQKMINDKNINDNFRTNLKRGIKYYDRLIKICHKYKHQQAVTDEWFNNYLKQQKEVA